MSRTEKGSKGGGNARDQAQRLLEHESAVRNHGWHITPDGYCVNNNAPSSKAHCELDARVYKQRPSIDGVCVIHGWPQPCGPCHT